MSKSQARMQNVCMTQVKLANADSCFLQIGKTALKRRPFVKVINIRNKQEKTLYDDCEGNFTTSPSALQIFLPELLEYLSDCLPLQVTCMILNCVHHTMTVGVLVHWFLLLTVAPFYCSLPVRSAAGSSSSQHVLNCFCLFVLFFWANISDSQVFLDSQLQQKIVKTSTCVMCRMSNTDHSELT